MNVYMLLYSLHRYLSICFLIFYVRQNNQRNKPLVFFCLFPNKQVNRNRKLNCSRLDSSAVCRHPQNCPPRCRPFHSRISPRFPHGRLSRRSPIKENKVACLRLIVLVLPLPPAFEPVYTVRAEGKFRDNAAFQIAALFTAPRNKTGTPFHTPVKAVPAPIRLSALVTELRQGNLHNGLIAATCKRPPVWIVS